MSTPWGVFLLHGKDMTMRWQRGDGDHGDQAPPHLPLEKEENKNSSSSLIEGVWKTGKPSHAVDCLGRGTGNRTLTSPPKEKKIIKILLLLL